MKQQRSKKKISARQLSARAGLSSSYVSKLENGKIDPTTTAFGQIARVLELSALEVGVAVFASLEDGSDGEVS